MDDNQQTHWDHTFIANPDFFGRGASQAAIEAAATFGLNKVTSILELGCGQGRDSLYLAEQGFNVTALDYSQAAIATLRQEAARRGLPRTLVADTYDVRAPLPFPDASFDACFGHMLLCMELSPAETSRIMSETLRVLKPGGLSVQTVRSEHDPHYRQGTRIDEDMYDIGGFVVRFFTEPQARTLASGAGFEIPALTRLKDGRLPRDLYMLTLRKPGSGVSLLASPQVGGSCCLLSGCGPGGGRQT